MRSPFVLARLARKIVVRSRREEEGAGDVVTIGHVVRTVLRLMTLKAFEMKQQRIL